VGVFQVEFAPPLAGLKEYEARQRERAAKAKEQSGSASISLSVCLRRLCD
jgi:hypothetical protein